MSGIERTMSFADEVPMDISDELILNSDEDDMTFDLNDSRNEEEGQVSKIKIFAAGVDETPLLQDFDVHRNIESSAANESIWSNLDAITAPDQVQLLLSPSPKKTPKSASIAAKEALLGKTVKILVPATIANGCVKIKHNPDSKGRSYCNVFFERSVEMTKDKLLWEKLDTNDLSGDADERPDIIQYNLPTVEQIISLYRSLDLYSGKLVVPSLENVDRKYRLDSVLIRGVNGMDTSHVFLLLRSHSHIPEKLEWINDAQCVVVFPDQYEAARCLMDLGKPVTLANSTEPPPAPEEFDDTFETISEVPKNWVEIPMPNSHIWRFTVSGSHDKKTKPGFLLSIAKNSDKKQEHAETFSDYYRAHGNPNSKERQGIWTKTGYEAKMRRKQSVLAMRGSPPPFASTSATLVEARLPVQFRLGSPIEDQGLDDTELNYRNNTRSKHADDENLSSPPLKLDRRSVIIKRRKDGPERIISTGIISRQRGGDRWMDNEDDEDDLPVSRDFENIGSARRPPRRRSWNHARRQSSPGVPRGSIHDRLGW